MKVDKLLQTVEVLGKFDLSKYSLSWIRVRPQIAR